MPAPDTNRQTCRTCDGAAVRWGRDRVGQQRWRCKGCGRTWTDAPARPLGPKRLPVERAVLVLSLLVEGNSIRSAERITGHHRDTIMRLLARVGGKCEALLDRLLVSVEVQDVEADEIWAYVGMNRRPRRGSESSTRSLATPTPA